MAEPGAQRRTWRLRSPLWQLTISRCREYSREPEAVFWSFGFPLLLALALGIAFKTRGPATNVVAVEESAGTTGQASHAAAQTIASALARDPAIDARIYPAAEATDKLRTGKVSVVVIPAGSGHPLTYRYDPTRPESRLARALADDALQRAAGRAEPLATALAEVTEPGSRYIDFLLPGLIGMNLMSASMWGIGWTIVNARTRRLLKRFAATPMRRRDYLLAQLFGRLVFVVVEVGAVLVFGRLVFDVTVHGSYAALAFLSFLGTLSFSSLGLLVASRARTAETVSGLMNLLMLPMFMVSGVFFAATRFPAFAQPLIRILPLTAMNDALRAIIVDGAPLWSPPLMRELATLMLWGIGAFLLALRLFRWR